MKNYSILRIAPVGSFGLKEYVIKKHSDFINSNYQRQQQIYFENKYQYADGFSKAMKRLGNDANEIIYDFDIMQKQWANENKVDVKDKTWQIDILKAQIKKIKPDILYFQGSNLYETILEDYEKEFPFLKLIVGYFGHLHGMGKKIDLLFLGTEDLVNKYKPSLENKVHLLYHGFDDDVLNYVEVNKKEKKYDFIFAGSSGFGYFASHMSRYWALREILEKSNIKLWITEDLKQKERYKNKIYPKGFQCMESLFDLYPEKCNEPVYGIDMYNLLSKTKVLFNMHTEIAVYASSGAMRLFEATGMGTCILTDKSNNVFKLFNEDEEIVCYSSIDECIEKLNFLLENEKKIKEIGVAAQRRVLKDHTVFDRCQRIDELIKGKL